MHTKVFAEVLELVKTEDFKKALRENILLVSATLDRRLQKEKMINVFGWDPEVIDSMEVDYIKFLSLIKTFKDFGIDFKIIPNLYIDEFWHNHILDTQQYYEDCQKIFNEMLHHFPYYGVLGEEDNKNWKAHSYICQTIWKECFGENLYDEIDSEEDGYKHYKRLYKELSEIYKQPNAFKSTSKCRSNCKPQRCP